MLNLNTYVFVLGELSVKTLNNINTELENFKKLNDIPISNSDADNTPLLPGHSHSNLFLHKHSVSDKMIADCVESLIGSYVYVRINSYNTMF